jgi:AraC-like DNA-binding protein
VHFFCGFTLREIAEQRNMSERTVQRDFRKARLLLHQAVLDDGGAAAAER